MLKMSVEFLIFFVVVVKTNYFLSIVAIVGYGTDPKDGDYW